MKKIATVLALLFTIAALAPVLGASNAAAAPGVDCGTPEHTNDPECSDPPAECAQIIEAATASINHHIERANRAELLALQRGYRIEELVRRADHRLDLIRQKDRKIRQLEARLRASGQ